MLDSAGPCGDDHEPFIDPAREIGMGCEKERRIAPHHIAVQQHAAPAAAGEGPMRVECSGFPVLLLWVFQKWNSSSSVV